jgi:tungstate transport system substrate-binding protein
MMIGSELLRRRILAVLLLIAVGAALLTACGREPRSIRLATTTSTVDSGLLDVLAPVFEKKYGIEVDILSLGTGQALETGRRGDADVVLVHARQAEDEFVASGHGIDRRDVMHNDFVLVGDPSDSADVRGYNAVQALAKIASSGSLFVSRGDDSGTHKKEMALWKAAGLGPSGDWYLKAGSGMGETLLLANEKGAYTLADRGTYLAFRDKIRLAILVQNDPPLLNPYGIIAVNPKLHKDVNYRGAMKFIDFITSAEGQEIIAEFGKDKYGEPLFFPDAIK